MKYIILSKSKTIQNEHTYQMAEHSDQIYTSLPSAQRYAECLAKRHTGKTYTVCELQVQVESAAVTVTDLRNQKIATTSTNYQGGW